MKRRALVRAADKMLGSGSKTKPQNNMVPNPYYQTTRLDWRLKINGKGPLNEGLLEISFRKRGTREKVSLEFPCILSHGKCMPRKINGARKIVDGKGDCIVSEPFNILELEGTQMMGVVNDIVESIARNCSMMLRTIQSGIIEGLMALTPDLLRVEEDICVHGEVSLEALEEEGSYMRPSLIEQAVRVWESLGAQELGPDGVSEEESDEGPDKDWRDLFGVSLARARGLWERMLSSA
jgi:hypothetical protein